MGASTPVQIVYRGEDGFEVVPDIDYGGLDTIEMMNITVGTLLAGAAGEHLHELLPTFPEDEAGTYLVDLWKSGMFFTANATSDFETMGMLLSQGYPESEVIACLQATGPSLLHFVRSVSDDDLADVEQKLYELDPGESVSVDIR